jgi:hypothetical protein
MEVIERYKAMREWVVLVDVRAVVLAITDLLAG